MENYIIDPQFLADETAQKISNLSKNKPGADFVEFASGIIYDRLKKDILHYRAYGVYWWALKNTLRSQGYNVGDETDEIMLEVYNGRDDAKNIVAADTFFQDQASIVIKGNTRWMLDRQGNEYVLYDSDMETRASVDDPIV